MEPVREQVRLWFCKDCGSRVELHYDHVGPRCTGNSSRRDCPGTFAHTTGRGMPACLNRGRSIGHDRVELKAS
jgi:hypothetical protein